MIRLWTQEFISAQVCQSMNTFHVGDAALLDGAMVVDRELPADLVPDLRSDVVVSIRIEPLSTAFAIHALEEAL